MKNWHWKAILGGLGVDFGGGIILGIPIAILLFAEAARNGALNSATAPTPSLTLLVISAVMGLFMDALGGYLTAMWAPNRKIAHATIMGCASLVLGLLFRGFDNTAYPAWFTSSWMLVLPCAFLGGWWRVQQHGPESAPKVKPETKGDSAPAPIASPFGD
jgi:hypothetical protein